MALTAQQLANALRITADAEDAVPTEHAPTISRLLGVTDAMVMLYAPSAPETVRDEARVRLAGYLFDRPPESPSAGALFYSGAQGLLSSWRAPPALSTGGETLERPLQPSQPSQPAPGGGDGTGLTDEQAADIANSIPAEGLTVDGTDLNVARNSGLNPITLELPGISVEDEGNLLGGSLGVHQLNFTGQGVRATRLGDEVTVDVASAPDDKRLVPVVGRGDVGRILTAPQVAGGQPTWNSNPGQTAAQVLASIVARVSAWARGVGRIPESALPPKADDFIDALSEDGYKAEGNVAADNAFVSSHWSTVAKPDNIENSPFAYVHQFENSPRYTNVFAAIRVPNKLTPQRIKMRLAVLADGYTLYVPREDWVLVEVVGMETYYTAPVADAPVGATVNVERYIPFTLDGPAVGVQDWATVGGPAIPADRVLGNNGFQVVQNGVIGLAINSDRDSIGPRTSFDVNTTIGASEQGVLAVTTEWLIPSSSASQFRVSRGQRSTQRYLFSELRASADADNSATTGLRLSGAQLIHVSTTDGTIQGNVAIRVARQASNELVFVMTYDASQSTGGLAGSVQCRVEATVLRHDGAAGGALADDSVTTAKIKDGAVTGVKIADGAVSGGKLLAIGSSKILDDAVTNTKIAAGAVTAAKIGALAVTAAKIAANAVTAAKLAAAVLARMAPSPLVANKYLKVNAAGNAVELVDAPSGGSSTGLTYTRLQSLTWNRAAQTATGTPKFTALSKTTVDSFDVLWVRRADGFGQFGPFLRHGNPAHCAGVGVIHNDGDMTPCAVRLTFTTNSSDSTQYDIQVTVGATLDTASSWVWSTYENSPTTNFELWGVK